VREYRSFYKRVAGNEGQKCNYPTRLDTYGCGCAHDCSYCYAKSLLDFRGLWRPDDPAVAPIKEVEKLIKGLPREVVRLGGMTDCYQPVERTYRNTRKTIRLLDQYRVPYLIVTKSALILDDIDILDPDLAHVQITVTTTDDELSATYEKASPPSERIRAIEALQERGIDVQVRLSPFIPEFVDIEKINAIRCNKILVEFLRVNPFIKQWLKIDYSPYTVQRNGYRHLPLRTKKKLLEGLDFAERSVCEDESIAYSYWKYHYNSNPRDCCNLRGVQK
jgi:DNA repair photolyase